MKRLLFILSFMLGFTSFGQTQNDWDKRASFGGLKRTRAVAFAIGDYGYVGTGLDTAEMTHNDLWKYDPSFNTWTQVASIPGSTRRNAVGVAIGEKGYVGTGADSATSWMGNILSDWWEYDPVLNTWTGKASYPGGYDMWNNTNFSGGVYFATAFSIGSKGYICGGKMGSDFYGTDLWEYDPLLDTWTRKANFPGLDRYQLSSFSIDGKGYVGMGVDHDLYRKDWWQYDPQLDSWQQVADLPGVERGGSATFVLGQRGFVVFGADGGYKDELWEYNPFNDSWQIRANFPGGERKNGIAFAIGDSAYAGTGKGYSGKKRSFYRYYPLLPVGTEENQLSIEVYPNPASNYLKIDGNSQLFTSVELYDMRGTKVLQSESTYIDITSLSEGTYVILISDATNTPVQTDKIIIRR
ncbi:MAG: T9SS type A sorting domain-containing protein [Crocinitomicaceae bacterium]|nr:T9SS type A sorting domain-containing protein [Crocinitomicaceae bacterium]